MLRRFIRTIGVLRFCLVILCLLLIGSVANWLLQSIARIKSVASLSDDVFVSNERRSEILVEKSIQQTGSNESEYEMEKAFESDNQKNVDNPRASVKFASERNVSPFQSEIVNHLPSREFVRRRYLAGIVLRNSGSRVSPNRNERGATSFLSKSSSKSNPNRASNASPPESSVAKAGVEDANPTVTAGSSSYLRFQQVDPDQVEVFEITPGTGEKLLAVQLTDARDRFVVFDGEGGKDGWQRVFEALFAATQDFESGLEKRSTGIFVKNLSEKSDLRILGIQEKDTILALNDTPFTIMTADALVSQLDSDLATLKLIRDEQEFVLGLFRFAEE